MSSLREQCDFMSNVVRRAIIMGMNHERFSKLAETAWLVLTAEPASAQETSVVTEEGCSNCQGTGRIGTPSSACPFCGGEGVRRRDAPETSDECTCGVGAPDRMPHDVTCPQREPLEPWRCTICNRVNPDDATYCRQCEFSRMIMQDGRRVPRNDKLGR